MSEQGRVYGFGIVGCGVIGPRHARCVAQLPNARLVAVTDEMPERAKALAGEHGCDVAEDLDHLLERPDVDVVSVCVPSGLHAEIGELAAGAGKHLVIEKPIDVSLPAADRLIAAASAAGVAMTVISQHRFDPGVVALHELLSQGRLGRLLLGAARIKWYRSLAYYDSAAWRGTWDLDGGGALINQGVHYTDLLRWCMGPVSEVRAVCATEAHEIEVEDVALAVLRFRSGAVGSLEATTVAYPGFRERLEISGSEGSAVIEDGQMVMRELIGERGDVGAYGTREASSSTTGSGAADPAAIGEDAHTSQIADLLDAIGSGRQPLVTGADAREALELVLAVYESARLGTAVTLPLGNNANGAATNERPGERSGQPAGGR
jgi:UDP-N-acetyl-2-amino-2-deoxyglucuronate dehydrogenase